MYYSENKLSSNSRPNLIWIFADQLRFHALGCNGDPNVHTPNLDMLSQTGIQIDGGGVSGMPLCCPFRGSLITGLYPHKVMPGHEFPLDPSIPTIADCFHEGGYATSYFGKWHLDGLKNAENTCENYRIPRNRRGHFQRFLGYENNNSPFNTWVHGHTETQEIEPYHLEGYETDCLTDIFIDYLKEDHSSVPFFSVLSVQPPHDPHFAPSEFMGRHTPAQVQLRDNVPPIASIEERARRHISGYYGQIENLDYNIGRILDVLEETNLADNTHILFFSDHGEMMGSHGHFRKMSPYEESIRIPVILSGGRRTVYKHGLKGGYREKVCFNHVDFGPTSLGLCGLTPPDYMEGTDYSYLRQPEKEAPAQIPPAAYIQSVIPTKHFDSVDKPFRGIVTRDGFKYVCLENMEWMLFNLNVDPFEYVNLAHEQLYLSKRKELHALLSHFIHSTQDDFPLPSFI